MAIASTASYRCKDCGWFTLKPPRQLEATRWRCPACQGEVRALDISPIITRLFQLADATSKSALLARQMTETIPQPGPDADSSVYVSELSFDYKRFSRVSMLAIELVMLRDIMSTFGLSEDLIDYALKRSIDRKLDPHISVQAPTKLK